MNLDELVGAIKDTPSTAVGQIIQAGIERFGRDAFRAIVDISTPDATNSDPFCEGLVSASELPDGGEPECLYFGVYANMITLYIGETGAGKSVALYNFAINAALGRVLWGESFARPLRVLYIDPENAGSYRGESRLGGLCRKRLGRIGLGKPKNLWFHDGVNVNLGNSFHMEYLAQRIRELKIDVLIIDPIADLYHLDDENSNAEGAAQVNGLKQLARRERVAIIIAHHTGKNSDDNYGRGASARLASADVGIVMRSRNPDGDTYDDDYRGEVIARRDLVRIHVVKDRPGQFGRGSLYLRMVGDDQFERIGSEEWRNIKSASRASADQRDVEAKRAIIGLLEDGVNKDRGEIVALMKDKGFSRDATDRALSGLREAGEILHMKQNKKDVYWFDPFADVSPNLLPSVREP